MAPDLPGLRPGDYRRYSASGFMDLHLDVLSFENVDGEPVLLIALAHNFRHPSGDIIPDPDMQIRIYPERGCAEAIAYQDCYSFREVYDQSGNADAREQAGQNDFLVVWLTNIHDQGFTLAERRGFEE